MNNRRLYRVSLLIAIAAFLIMAAGAKKSGRPGEGDGAKRLLGKPKKPAAEQKSHFLLCYDPTCQADKAIIRIAVAIGLGLTFPGAAAWGDSPGSVTKSMKIPRVVSTLDANRNGINDTDDLITGARLEAERKPVYKSAYYVGGHPPETEGVCTDVIWRKPRASAPTSSGGLSLTPVTI